MNRLCESTYAVMAEYLGVRKPDAETLHYTRFNPASNRDATIRLAKQPNIILVMLESLGASRLGGLPAIH